MTAALIREKPAVACMTVPCHRGRGKPLAKQAGGLRARAWWVMRRMVRFSLDQLVMTVVDGSEAAAPSNLQKYITALECVGVLVKMPRRQPGTALTSNGHVVWQLARNLGRKPPVWRGKTQRLFDPNSGELLPPLIHPATALPGPPAPLDTDNKS